MKKRKETLLLHFPFFLFSFFTVRSVRTASSFSISFSRLFVSVFVEGSVEELLLPPL